MSIMRNIKVEPSITMEQLLEFANQWRDSDNITLAMPEELSEEEINRLFSLVSGILPMDFGYCILQELVEREKIPKGLLSKILSLGDRGCIESVCLRDDLDTELREMCEELSLHKKGSGEIR